MQPSSSRAAYSSTPNSPKRAEPGDTTSFNSASIFLNSPVPSRQPEQSALDVMASTPQRLRMQSSDNTMQHPGAGGNFPGSSMSSDGYSLFSSGQLSSSGPRSSSTEHDSQQ